MERYVLDVVGASGWSREFSLTGPTRVGRSPESEIQVPDLDASKRHAEILPFSGGGWRVRDCGSRNGTWKNGERIDGRAALAVGDVLRVGRTKLTLRRRTSSETIVVAAMPSRLEDDFRPAQEIDDPIHLRADYEKLRLANRLSRGLSTGADIVGVLEQVLSFAVEVFGGGSGAVLRVQKSKVTVLAGELVDVSSTVLKRVVESREALVLADANDDPALAGAHSIMALGIRSVMAVPLVVDEEVHSVLLVQSESRARPFLHKDLRLLMGLSSQVASALQLRMLVERRERDAATRAHLSRFLAPELVEQVVSGDLRLERGGRVAEIAVLFCDIRGFVPFAEKIGAESTMRMLNRYFDELVAEVFAHGGMVDKFVGDELMAVWGIPRAGEDDVARCLQCALAIQRRVARLDAELRHQGMPPLACGIGVNAGPALVGLVGAARRMQFTSIGDTVNVASRLCSIAQSGQVLTRPELAVELAGIETTDAAPIQVKGKSGDVNVVAVRHRGDGEAR